MDRTWTADQVAALAPDLSSLKAAQGLAAPARWRTLGRDDRALWGEIVGSGADPYRTCVDLAVPAFKCSCPSRKLPCKHAMGVLFLHADRPQAVARAQAPEWVRQWVESRDQRSERKAHREEARDIRPADPAAREKRSAQRAARVESGVEELALWLRDLVRQGLAGLPAAGYASFDRMAARLVDAQAPGLSRLVRELGGASFLGEGWERRLFDRLARLHLLVEAYRRRESLPEDVRSELASLVGYTQSRDDLLARDAVADEWFVLGSVVEVEERLKVARTWLHGMRTGRRALLLAFAAGAQPLELGLMPGQTVPGQVVFYPAAWPLRALLKDAGGPEPVADTRGSDRQEPGAAAGGLPGTVGIAAGLDAYADALCRDPWLERHPLALASVVAVRAGGQWLLRDAQGCELPLSPRCTEGFRILALSGGHPVDVFGELDGDTLAPLTVWSGSGLVPLTAPSLAAAAHAASDAAGAEGDPA